MVKKRGKAKKQAVRPMRSIPMDRVLFYGVLLLVFALPLFIWPGISEYGYGKTIVALIGISALAMVWGLSAWQKGTWTLRIPWIMVPMLGLVAASLFSMLHATNGRVVVQSLVLLVFFALFLLIIANAVRDQRDIHLLLFSLLAAGFLAALYGLLQYLGVLRGPMGNGGLSDVISTMGNRNYLGGFLAYLLFPAVVLVVRPRARWLRIASILLIAFCFGMVLVVRQSGTLIALGLSGAAFVVGWLIFRPVEPLRQNRIWLLILLAVLAFTFLVEAPSGPLNSVVGLSSEVHASGSDNLLHNPDFEAGETGWGPNGSLQEGEGTNPTQWWRIDRTEKNRADTCYDDTGHAIWLDARSGENLEFGGSLISDGHTTGMIYVYAYDEQKHALAVRSAGSTTGTAWRSVSSTFKTPEGTKFLVLRLWATARDGWVGFDDVFLRRIGPIEATWKRLSTLFTDRTRSWDWWIGWEMFKDHPLTGVGLGNYKLDFLPYKAAFLATPRGEAYDFHIDRAAQAHNEYVQVLAELGILGVLALGSLLVVLAVSLWKRLRSNGEENRFDLLLFTCGIVAFLLHGAVSFPAHLPASTLVLVLIGGLAFSRVHGEAGTFTVLWTGWKLKAVFTSVVVIGLVVSIVAGRDLHANLLMSKGIEQLQFGNSYGAEAYFEDSIRFDFAARHTYFHLASVQIERGAYEDAEANLERCLTRFVDETVYLNYANLMANTGRFDAARDTIALLLAGNPKPEAGTRARYLDAVIIAQSGDPRAATSLLEELVRDAPDFQTAYIGLGSIYEARGMPTNAHQAFEEALRLIEKKLAAAQEDLENQTTITAERYGALRAEIAQLRQERTVVLGKLN